MDRLREILLTIWSKVVSLLQAFENSSLFERIMRKYESLSPRGQNTFRTVVKMGSIVLIALLILGGPFILLSKINDIKTLEKLESDAMVFQAEYDAQTRGYTAPEGWKPLASSSPEELASAFNEYLPSIGVPEQLGSLVASGENLNLTLREVSIRQITHIIFELEGLYPKVRAQSLRLRPNATQKDIMDMEGTFVFNPAFANQVSIVSPTGPSQEDEYVPPTPNNHGVPHTTTPSTTKGGNTDYQNDYVPPPPPSAGEYDEYTPPEVPDDLPPPPPPPGFEEEQQ